MRLELEKVYAETSEGLEENSFGVSDMSVIFDILRNKMYSNPIYAICREISCNARDAHREIGKENVPIKIVLPTILDPIFKVKDYGPGISPDRMVNIFINYAASTKRDNNIQTGGFGLGAKTPFSYSDTFTIKTIVDGILYNYACFIDESKLGKLIKLSEEATEEENGTEIIIPVESKDFLSFKKGVVQAVKHWDVKPVVINLDHEINEPNVILSGKFWKIIKHNTYSASGHYAIVDGIEYPLDTKHFDNHKIFDVINKNHYSYRNALCLLFETGELSLSANREQLYLDDKDNKSLNTVMSKLDAMCDDIKKMLNDKIASCPSLIEASQEYSRLCDELCVYNASIPTWNGHKLFLEDRIDGVSFYYFGLHSSVGNTTVSRELLSAYDINDGYKTILKLSKLQSKFLFFEKNDITLNITKKNAIRYFKKNPTEYNLAIVIVDPDKADQNVIQHLKDHLDYDDYENHFTIPKSKAKNTNYTAPLILFKFQNGSFYRVALKDFKDDKSKKISCTLSKNSFGEKVITVNNNKLSMQQMSNIVQCLNTLGKDEYSFYAVKDDAPKDKVKKSLKGCTSLTKKLKEYLNSTKIDFQAVKYNNIKNVTKYYNFSYVINSLNEHISTIKNPNSLVKDLIKAKEITIELESHAPLLFLYEAINGEIDLKSFKSNNLNILTDTLIVKFYKQYPLLELIGSYDFSYNIGYICEYINLIDNKENNKNV